MIIVFIWYRRKFAYEVIMKEYCYNKIHIIYIYIHIYIIFILYILDNWNNIIYIYIHIYIIFMKIFAERIPTWLSQNNGKSCYKQIFIHVNLRE